MPGLTHNLINKYSQVLLSESLSDFRVDPDSVFGPNSVYLAGIIDANIINSINNKIVRAYKFRDLAHDQKDFIIGFTATSLMDIQIENGVGQKEDRQVFILLWSPVMNRYRLLGPRRYTTKDPFNACNPLSAEQIVDRLLEEFGVGELQEQENFRKLKLKSNKEYKKTFGQAQRDHGINLDIEESIKDHRVKPEKDGWKPGQAWSKTIAMNGKNVVILNDAKIDPNGIYYAFKIDIESRHWSPLVVDPEAGFNYLLLKGQHLINDLIMRCNELQGVAPYIVKVFNPESPHTVSHSTALLDSVILFQIYKTSTSGKLELVKIWFLVDVDSCSDSASSMQYFNIRKGLKDSSTTNMPYLNDLSKWWPASVDSAIQYIAKQKELRDTFKATKADHGIDLDIE